MSVRNSNRWLVWAVVASAVFMSNLDVWIVNVAFVDIGSGLHASLADVSWVLDAYTIALAALLIPAGRLGDRHGHRAVFLAGVTLFTVASLACALAPDLGVLIVARIGQAAGAAAQLPSSLALLMAAVAPEARTHTARSWSAVGAVAAVLGPVVGGLLVTLDWRWVFVVNLPIGAAAVLVGRRVLPRPPARSRESLPDLVAAALLTVAVAALTGALVQAPAWGWGAGRTLGLLAAALIAGWLFGRRSLRHRHPLIELHLLRVRRFAVANAGTTLFSAAFAIMLLGNSLWCQQVWHYSALRTGFALAPGPLLVPFVTAWSARLIPRTGLAPLAAAGSLLFGIAMGLRVFTAQASPSYATDLLPAMIIGGVGVGLALSTFIAAGATALPPERSATASGTVNSVRQVASGLGVAVLVTFLDRGGSVLGRFHAAWWVAVALSVAAAVVGLGLRESRPAEVTLPAPAAVRPAARRVGR